MYPCLIVVVVAVNDVFSSWNLKRWVNGNFLQPAIPKNVFNYYEHDDFNSVNTHCHTHLLPFPAFLPRWACSLTKRPGSLFATATDPVLLSSSVSPAPWVRLLARGLGLPRVLEERRVMPLTTLDNSCWVNRKWGWSGVGRSSFWITLYILIVADDSAWCWNG